MIGAASSLVAMALLVRFLTPEYHVLELIFSEAWSISA